LKVVNRFIIQGGGGAGYVIETFAILLIQGCVRMLGYTARHFGFLWPQDLYRH
jgi:hypothetical protein